MRSAYLNCAIVSYSMHHVSGSPSHGWLASTLFHFFPEMADSVRSACYSNVHVYEFPVRGIPVMIRKEDSYVNATQILRAAGLPKPARTKVLEREVTRGVHEKVQGGYAGSQGTWIPLESAKLLADTYGIRDECEQLFSYDMSSGLAESVSPPLKQKKTVQPKPSNSDVEQSSSGNFLLIKTKEQEIK